MDQIIIIVGIVIIVLLLAVVAVLAVIAYALMHRNKRNKESLEYVIDKTIEDAFKREKKKIARMYVEERKVVEWIEEMAEQGELDITKLATETEQRAYALALKKAEDAVVITEGGLEAIRQEIRKAQGDLPSKVYQPASGPYKNHNETLHRLYKQEKVAEKRVKSARKRLTLLTSDISTTDLEEALESLEAAPAMVPLPEPPSDPLILPIETGSVVSRDPEGASDISANDPSLAVDKI